MSTPNKFWFHHESDESRVYFASRDGDNYVVTGGNLGDVMHYYAEFVEKYIVKGLWVLTIPDHFRVVGNLTGIEYSFLKDANNLYVQRSTIRSTPEFRSKEWVMEGLYEDCLWTPLVYEYDEEFGSKRAERAVEESPKKSKEVKKMISININDVYAAAKFDVDHNKHTKVSVSDVEKEIISYIKTMYADIMAGKLPWERNSTATRSYHVVFTPESENYGTISVLSSASIGMPVFFADVAEFLNQN